jgi:adenosylcobinamide-GDP ribazoletransferase
MRGELFHHRVWRLRRLIGSEARLAGTAWLHFTRIPLPDFATNGGARVHHSAAESVRYIPLVGVGIGAIAGSVFLGAYELFDSKPLAIALSIAASFITTGAFHEAGMAGFFDAFAGKRTKRHIFEIMRDSRIGTFGSLALISVLFVKFQALLLVPSHLIPSVLIAAHAFSRFAAGSFMFTHALIEKNEAGSISPTFEASASSRDFIIMSFLGMTPLLLVGNLLFLLLIPILWLVRNLFGAWFIRKLGGYTGNCLGATQQTIEVLCYLLVVIGLVHPFSIG